MNNENFQNLDIECVHTWFNKPFNAAEKVINSRLTRSQLWLSCICGSELAAAAKIKWCLDSPSLRLQRPEWIYLPEKMSQQLCLHLESLRGWNSTTIPSEYASTGNRLLIKCPGVRWNELLKRYCWCNRTLRLTLHVYFPAPEGESSMTDWWVLGPSQLAWPWNVSWRRGDGSCGESLKLSIDAKWIWIMFSRLYHLLQGPRARVQPPLAPVFLLGCRGPPHSSLCNQLPYWLWAVDRSPRTSAGLLKISLLRNEFCFPPGPRREAPPE